MGLKLFNDGLVFRTGCQMLEVGTETEAMVATNNYHPLMVVDHWPLILKQS